MPTMRSQLKSSRRLFVLYLEMRKEVELLTDRLAEYEDAEPAMSGQTKVSSVTGSGFSDNMSFEQRVNAALGAV